MTDIQPDPLSRTTQPMDDVVTDAPSTALPHDVDVPAGKDDIAPKPGAYDMPAVKTEPTDAALLAEQARLEPTLGDKVDQHVSKEQYSPADASEAAKVLADDSSSDVMRSAAGHVLAEARTNPEPPADASEAARILADDSSSAAQKSAAGQVLAEARNDENK